MHRGALETFAVEVTKSDRDYLVALTGQLDQARAPELARLFDVLAHTIGARVVVEISELTFIDSSGIRTLIGAAHAVGAYGGVVTLTAPQPNVRRAFDSARVGDLIAIDLPPLDGHPG